MMRMKRCASNGILLRAVKTVFSAAPVFECFNILVSLAYGILSGLSVTYIQVFFDAISAHSAGQPIDASLLNVVAPFFVILISTEILSTFFNGIGKVWTMKVEGKMSVKLVRACTQYPPLSYENPAYLDQLNKAKEGMRSCIYMVGSIVVLLAYYVPYFLIVQSFLYRVSGVLSIILCLSFVPAIWEFAIHHRRSVENEDEVAILRRKKAAYSDCIIDPLFFKETRLLGAYRYFAVRLQESSTAIAGRRLKLAHKMSSNMLLVKGLSLSCFFALLAVLAHSAVAGNASIGGFSAVFLSVMSLFAAIDNIVHGQVGYIIIAGASAKNFISFIDDKTITHEDAIAPSPVCETDDIAIAFQDVSFSYPNASAVALKKVNVKIMKGETVAIVGENGSGKTTLARILLGLYQPDQGCVVCGRQYKNSSAFQQFAKYKMTLQENVEISDMGRNEPARAQALCASSAIQVDCLSDGYKTMLSKEFDGTDLSGGEWQRIAIARGLYRLEEGIMVFDEPTAAIDPIEETRLFSLFHHLAQGTTSIIITHRLGSARIAERILVMDQGQIVQEGTHDELVAKHGKYADMYEQQAQWYQ